MNDRRTLTALAFVAALGLGATAQASPGSLAFAASSASISESGGAVEFSVRRTGGSDGLVTVDIATMAGTATGDVDYESNSATLAWEAGDSSPKTFTVALIQDTLPEGPETFQLVLSQPLFGATLGSPSQMTVTIVDDDSTFPACSADQTTLCLDDGRFQVSIDWRFPPNVPDYTAAQVASFQTDDSGLFYFSQASNLEFLIKVLDGCAINDHYWVFFAATTNVEFEVTVIDTENDVEIAYTNPLGQSADAVTDTSAFATCP